MFGTLTVTNRKVKGYHCFKLIFSFVPGNLNFGCFKADRANSSLQVISRAVFWNLRLPVLGPVGHDFWEVFYDSHYVSLGVKLEKKDNFHAK